MLDIVLESIRTLILAILLFWLWKQGQYRFSQSKRGWNSILMGFGLLLFGSALDITDNFESLNWLIVMGDTPIQATLEKLVGFLGGFLLLAIGLRQWIPSVQKLSNEVEERKKGEQKLTEANYLLQNVIDSSPDLIFVKDTQLRTMFCNKSFAQAVGKSPEEMYGYTDLENGWAPELIYGDPSKGIRGFEQDDKAALAGEMVLNPYDPADVEGEIRIFDTRKLPLLNSEGKTIGILGIARDSTERIQAEEKIKLSARVFSDSHEGIMITDANKIIVDVNPAFYAVTGYNQEEVIGQTPSILSSGKQSPEFYADMWRHIHGYGHWQGEIWNRKKNGDLYAELLTISALWDEKGETVNYIGVFSDITQSKQQQEKLNLMAHYDVLTGLPNRTLFTDRFYQAMAHSKRTKTQLAVCFLDLDNFKPVNDNFGHEIGDKLLIEVAQRITACIREEDTVSRQGGDEFALLLNDIESYEQVEQTLGRLHHALAKPYLINDHSLQLTASSGVTFYPDDAGDIDTLLRHADQAMYQAKQQGKHRYHLFDMEQDQEVIQKHHRLDEIQQALFNDEFCLHYQPKVNLKTGAVFGAEALIRWNHPDEGLIPPLDFLPIIEGTELELQIGDWVINQALMQLDTWQQQGLKLEVSINISSHHLLSDTFVAQLDAALAKYPSVDSTYLQVEILESTALGDLDVIYSIIKTCQDSLGVKVALDDFGTGYSSLTHLRNLSANTIKIDQTFIRDMLDDPSDYSIADSVIGLAASFNCEVIAEGVETIDHGLMLLLMGCEGAQGYGIAKPMPANEFPNWFSSYVPNQEWLLSGKQPLSRKESKRELFRLTTEQWKNKFIENILSETAGTSWPIMDKERCPCGAWLKRAKREQLFDKNGLKRIKQTHNELHFIANILQLKHQEGDLDAVRDGLEEFLAAFDEMERALQECE